MTTGQHWENYSDVELRAELMHPDIVLTGRDSCLAGENIHVNTQYDIALW